MDCQQPEERTLEGVVEVDEELIETFLSSSIQKAKLERRKKVGGGGFGEDSFPFPAIRPSVWGSIRYPHTLRRY